MSKSKPTSDPEIVIPEMLPVLPLRDMVVFPLMIVPLFISRDRSIKAVDRSFSENRIIFLDAQKDMYEEDPRSEGLYKVGTVSMIMRMLKLPDGRVRILAQGISRARVHYFDESSRHFLQARIKVIGETDVENPPIRIKALIRNVRNELEDAVNLGKNIAPEVMVLMTNLNTPGRLADLVASNLELKTLEAQKALALIDPVARLKKVQALMAKELELLAIQQKISIRAKGEIDKSQREFILRQQLKAIHQELGEDNEFSEEVSQIRKKLAKAKVPKEASEECERQLNRLERMHPDSAESAVIRNHLDWMVTLPWAKQTRDNLDMKRAQRILDQDHFGLEKVKERIIEYLAVRKLKKDAKGPILCFVGPPGVGKTSLGKSIARVLDRKFIRLSLGGVHDESEIRGHRRTYVGALPGRVIQGIHQAGSKNPVFMLDEVDKVGMDYRGDPSSALLEVLDPEQNHTFRDNYLGVTFDLSKVLFLTTANVLDPIEPAFLDRMETIELSGYTEEDKGVIAKKHLWPKQLLEHGLGSKRVIVSEEVVRAVISRYTREAGVRQLERQLGSICRKVARKIAEGQRAPVQIKVADLRRFLGQPKNLPETMLRENRVGVATGLAWTSAGGEIMFIEAMAVRGKGNLMLTGKLGEVMKESAQAALTFVRSQSQSLDLPETFFEEHDIHIHVPEGSIAKDGPSAGIAMATAMMSLFSGRTVRREVAMTGEITLRGNILPIGGLKEKILAARRAGIKRVLVPKLNNQELQELSNTLFKAIRLIPVDDVKEVFSIALASRKRSLAKGK